MLWMPLIAGSAALLTPTQSESRDTWTYGEAHNYCMAFFDRSPERLVIRFSAKTSDDTLLFFRKRLPSLTKDMSSEERQSAAARQYDLQLIVGDRQVSLTPQTGELRPKGMSGIVYVLGVDERSFVEALATNSELEIRRNGKMIARYEVANNATLATRLSTCVGTP